MSTRFPSRLTASMLVALGLIACAPTDTSHTLVLWHAWGGAELKALKGLIGIYETSHPGYDVMALQVPYDKLKDKYLRSASANGGPDLLIGDADWSGKFAASDLVVRTDELFTPSELARFYPSVLASLTLGKKMYALPESRETVALYYNKKLISQAPTTLEALFTAAEQIGIARGPDTYGLVYDASFYNTMGYFFGSGGKLFDQAGQPSVNSPGGLKALELLARISGAKGMLASPEYSKADSLYKEGRAAMIVNGPWALGDYRDRLKSNMGLALLPAISEGHPAASWVGVKCMMFNANSDPVHRSLAKDFALHMTSPASQRLLSDIAGHVPAVKGVELAAGSPLAIFQAQADLGTPVSIRPEISLVWDPMDKAVRQVIQHKSTPAQALSDAESVIKAKLEAVRAQAK
jgi:arabinogalactan oligomer/maltooligosaccharide transport system substrate-binding protein